MLFDSDTRQTLLGLGSESTGDSAYIVRYKVRYWFIHRPALRPKSQVNHWELQFVVCQTNKSFVVDVKQVVLSNKLIHIMNNMNNNNEVKSEWLYDLNELCVWLKLHCLAESSVLQILWKSKKRRGDRPGQHNDCQISLWLVARQPGLFCRVWSLRPHQPWVISL